MFTLLLPLQKKRLLTEYRMRLFIYVSICSSILGITSIVFIFPTLLALKQQHKEYLILKQDLETKIQKKSDDNLVKTIDDLKNNLSVAKDDVKNPTDVLKLLLGDKSKDIKIFSISYVASGQNVLNIKGVARDRESLLDFVNLLKEKKEFKGVELPISSLAKNLQIPFDISINISI